ncbi:MAG: Trk system potassium transporter TrkA [Treponema sp.]|jgi:trk system potassium uptake protein TrkA|nr:Trk system potassium transporter TrkA [Treponema sp.]
MRIVIAGAGNTGTQLAKFLIQEKHDVSLIESNEDRAKHVSNRLDCIVIHNKANNVKVLKEAGIEKADALICVTGYDEVNMIICGLAASLANEDKKLIKIARVYNDDYMQFTHPEGGRFLNIDHFIHPGMEAACSIIKAIEHGVIGDIVSFSNTPYELGSIEIVKDSAMDGLALVDYRKLVTHESLVTLVERNNVVVLPSGSTVLKHGDRIHVLADNKNLPDIYKLAGDTQKPIRKIGIAGGGKLGVLIAEGLLEKDSAINQVIKNKKQTKNYRVIFFEKDSKACYKLAARFPSALILHEDISDESFASDEELSGLDCLITATTNEELNIITAVYMKSKGVTRTIAIVNGSGHAAMARHLGVDVVIPMMSVVVDSILSHLMGSNVKEVHSLGYENIDLIEVEIGKNAPVIDKPISAFKLSEGGLLLLVNRKGVSFIPKGDYIFQEGDHIVVIANVDSHSEIEKYWRSSK